MHIGQHEVELRLSCLRERAGVDLEGGTSRTPVQTSESVCNT